MDQFYSSSANWNCHLYTNIFLKESKPSKLYSSLLIAFPHSQKGWYSKSKDRTSGKKQLLTEEQYSPFSKSWCLTLSKRLTWVILDNPQCVRDRLNVGEKKEDIQEKMISRGPKDAKETSKQFPRLAKPSSSNPLSIPSNNGIGFRCGCNQLVTDPQSSNPVIW